MITHESMPRVSVILPMYNARPYVGEAIESIINQTFQKWELLVIDDASTDGSPDVVLAYARKDTRIKLIRNNSDLHGPGVARNIGIDDAIGEYIAMMDSDDISLPKRLEKQVAFMDRHTDIVLSGCRARCFGASRKLFWSPPHDWLIKALLCFVNEPWGPSIIFRREQVKERYVPVLIGEDTLFAVNICLRHKVGNVPKTLYRYRVHANSITRKNDNYPHVKKVFQELLPLRLGFIPTDSQIDAHLAQYYMLFGPTKRSSTLSQLKWFMHVLIHARYAWYERAILALWFLAYSPKIILRNIPLVYKYYKNIQRYRSKILQENISIVPKPMVKSEKHEQL